MIVWLRILPILNYYSTKMLGQTYCPTPTRLVRICLCREPFKELFRYEPSQSH